MNCKNCEQVVDSNFCPHCGQSTKVGEINLRYFLYDLPGSIFQINSGFFYSMKELFVRPGHSIREYLSGKRKNHFKPIAYAFLISTIYFLLSRLVESPNVINHFIEGLFSDSNASEIDTDQLVILNWFAKHYAYAMLMLLPFYSLGSYLAFLGSGFNYLKHIVLNAYIIGQQAIFYSLASILSLIPFSGDLLVSTTLYIPVLYTFLVFWQFFSEQSRVAVVLRSILSYVLSSVILLIAASIIFWIRKTFFL